LLEEQLAFLKKMRPAFKAYNLNDGAAVIEGISYCALENVVLEGEKFQVTEVFHKFLLQDAKTEKAFQTFLKNEINDHSKWLFNIAREAKKGIHLSNTLFSSPTKQSAKIKTVLKLKTKLEKLVGVDYQTLVNYGYQAFMETLKPVESESDMSQQEMKNALIGFFGGLQYAAEGFLTKLDELKQEITFRLQELDPKTDFLSLAEHWLNQGIPGRFHVWIAHYASQPYEHYLKLYPEQVAQLEQTFQFMKTDESALEKHFHQRFNTPEIFALRLNQAFEQKDLQAVQDIARQLSFVSTSEHNIVNSLSTGMVLELKGHIEDALIHYLSVDPNKKHLCIQQQLFPLAFSLQKPDDGLQALNALSLMNIKYLPKYGEALSLLGEPDAAIAVFQAYPLLYEDTDALIQLIRLLVQQQQVEQANTLLQKAEASVSIDQEALQLFVNSLNKG